MRSLRFMNTLPLHNRLLEVVNYCYKELRLSCLWASRFHSGYYSIEKCLRKKVNRFWIFNKAKCLNPKFSLCQLPVRAKPKNESKDLVHWRSVLPFRLTLLLLYIIKHSSNLILVRGWCKSTVTFQTKNLAMNDIGFQQLTVVWKSSEYQRQCSNPIYISNIFASEKMNHLCLVFNPLSASVAIL